MTRDQIFITKARDDARKVWEGLNGLLEAQREWNAMDYGNTLENGVDHNEGILPSDVGAVIFATADEAKVRLLETGHATNLAKLL